VEVVTSRKKPKAKCFEAVIRTKKGPVRFSEVIVVEKNVSNF
jgi:hypothetical protein